MNKYLDDNGLLYLWGKIKNLVSSSAGTGTVTQVRIGTTEYNPTTGVISLLFAVAVAEGAANVSALGDFAQENPFALSRPRYVASLPDEAEVAEANLFERVGGEACDCRVVA